MGFTGNLSQQLKWMKSLEKKIPVANKKAFSGQKEKYEELAKAIMELVVYTPYPEGDNKIYKRTGDLIRSVFVGVSEEPMELGFGLDSSISPAVTTPAFSYGKYFLPEYSNRSFLVQTKPNTETRPFLIEWQLRITDNIMRKIEIELDEALK